MTLILKQFEKPRRCAISLIDSPERTRSLESMPTSNVIINADDYAMSADIDEGVLRLASMGIVTATSVMTLSPRWPNAAAALRGTAIDCGLHLDLTSAFARGNGGASLREIVLKSYFSGFDRQWLQTSIHRQLDLYEQGMDALPVFIDGHQHVHQLPYVRDALFVVLSERYPGHEASRIRLRDCRPKRWRGLKAAVIGALGGKQLAVNATSRGHSLNSDFAGVYDFAANAPLLSLWSAWLRGLNGPKPLIMCHPALETGTQAADPIRESRLREYAFLSSGAFSDLLSMQGVRPASWPAAQG